MKEKIFKIFCRLFLGRGEVAFYATEKSVKWVRHCRLNNWENISGDEVVAWIENQW